MANESQQAPRAATEQVVHWKGGLFPFVRREITAAQWKKAGVEDQKTVVWDNDNGFKVPVSEFNEAALKLLEKDDELNVRDA